MDFYDVVLSKAYATYDIRPYKTLIMHNNYTSFKELTTITIDDKPVELQENMTLDITNCSKLDLNLFMNSSPLFAHLIGTMILIPMSSSITSLTHTFVLLDGYVLEHGGNTGCSYVEYDVRPFKNAKFTFTGNDVNKGTMDIDGATQSLSANMTIDVSNSYDLRITLDQIYNSAAFSCIYGTVVFTY